MPGNRISCCSGVSAMIASSPTSPLPFVVQEEMDSERAREGSYGAIESEQLKEGCQVGANTTCCSFRGSLGVLGGRADLGALGCLGCLGVRARRGALGVLGALPSFGDLGGCSLSGRSSDPDVTKGEE